MKIAILGGAPSSKMLAPFKDPSWTIWACSPSNMDLPRVDDFFEIHAMDRVEEMAKYDHDMFNYMVWMRNHPRVWMQERHPKYPNSVRYPVEEIRARFCHYFFTSSVAYMLALAIMQEPEEIGIWGCDMNASDEYSHQRPGCQYFIDMCRKLEIKVTVPPESDLLLVSPPYAYCEANPIWRKMDARRAELRAAIKHQTDVIAEAKLGLVANQAALDTLEYAMATFVPVWPEMGSEEPSEKFPVLFKEAAE